MFLTILAVIFANIIAENQKNEIKNRQMKIEKENQIKFILNENSNKENIIKEKEIEIQKLYKEREELREFVLASRGESEEWEEFKVTFYDLSVQSCGKKKTHPEYGITFSGFNLKGLNWETARVIAIDPKVIPLHSKVKIRFFGEKYEQFSGVYQAKDTGRLIKGNRIDLFLGEDCTKQAMDLGVIKAFVQILK